MSARVFDFRPPLKVYRRHNCQRDHRSYTTFAKCVWPRALHVWTRWEEGTETPYALVIRCKKPHENWAPWRISLWATRSAAEHAGIAYCGGGCYQSHEVVRLENEKGPRREEGAISENISTHQQRNSA